MRLTCFVLLLLGFTANAMASSPSIVIETRLEPKGDIRVGQPLHYEIDVLTDTWLVDTPHFSNLEVANTLVMFEGSQGRNIQRDIGGKRYFGLTFNYRLIPLESGVITVPKFKVMTSIGQADDPIEATVPLQSFAVQALPSAVAKKVDILAGDIHLTQKILSGSQSATAGQPLVREIRVEAQRALALSIPALTPSSKGDFSSSHLPAEIKPLTDSRGLAMGGERIDRIRYIPENPGTYALPELSLTWWDIDEGKVQKATLPALEIKVATAKIGLSESFIGVTRSLFEVFGQYPGGWPGLILTAGFFMWTAQRYRRTIVTKTKGGAYYLLSLWRNSVMGLKHSAIQEIKAHPPELTGLYRLVRLQCDSTTIRHCPPPLQPPADILKSVSSYYTTTPDSKSEQQKLIKAIRRLKIQRPRPSHTNALVPLNPGQHET